MKAIIKINDIPFDEQLISRSILEYADNDDFDIEELTEDQLEEFEDYIMRNTDFDQFNEDLSCKLAEYVGKEYGKEYGDSFCGLPDNGDGIWFDGMEVDCDTFYEIRDKCHALANDTEWINKNISEYTIEYEF